MSHPPLDSTAVRDRLGRRDPHSARRRLGVPSHGRLDERGRRSVGRRSERPRQPARRRDDLRVVRPGRRRHDLLGRYEFRPERINLGMAGFAITVVAFFFSSVMDKLGRSASLIVLGTLLLAGGWQWEKLRRRLLAASPCRTLEGKVGGILVLLVMLPPGAGVLPGADCGGTAVALGMLPPIVSLTGEAGPNGGALASG